jgi:hypothetical protein
VRLNTGKGKRVDKAPYIVSRVDPKTQEIRHTYIRRAGKAFCVKMPSDALSNVEDPDNSSGSGRSNDGRVHGHNNVSQDSNSSSDTGVGCKVHDKLEFKTKTVRELLERMSKVKVRVTEKKVIPFIEPICPGHPFADLFPTAEKSPRKNNTPHPASGYDAEDSSSSN